MKKRNQRSIILSLALVVLIAVTALTGCSADKSGEAVSPSPEIVFETDIGEPAVVTSEADTDVPDSEQSTDSIADITEIGVGDTVFDFWVTDSSEETTVFKVHTDETTVGAALLANDLIAGDTSDYGLYVKSVNGITADYDTDKAYWAFHIDGEYAATGADVTNIEAGKLYAFIYTKE